MKSPLLYVIGLCVICWASLTAVIGCASLPPPPSDTPARIARIDAGISEARAVAVEARAVGREDIAREAETKASTLSDLRHRLESPAPAVIAAGQDIATGLSAVWPPFAVVASGLAGFAEFLRRKKARELVHTDLLLEEVKQDRAALQRNFRAADVIVRALEDPAAAPARKIVAKLAQKEEVSPEVEELISIAGARKPSHV